MQEQLLSWKRLEAYNYFENGYVRMVFSSMFGSGSASCVLLKAKVNPSQRAPDNAHEAQIIARKDGQIVSAHCKCMAGKAVLNSVATLYVGKVLIMIIVYKFQSW